MDMLKPAWRPIYMKANMTTLCVFVTTRLKSLLVSQNKNSPTFHRSQRTIMWQKSKMSPSPPCHNQDQPAETPSRGSGERRILRHHPPGCLVSWLTTESLLWCGSKSTGGVSGGTSLPSGMEREREHRGHSLLFFWCFFFVLVTNHMAAASTSLFSLVF